jgi:hypothetical protein
MGWEGIGTLIGKVADWLPGKREALQNKIDKIKKEMYEIQQIRPFNSRKYELLADQLRDAEQAENRAK